MQKYDIESLIQAFAEHAKQNDAHRENLIKRFQEEGSAEPDWMKDDFSISKAFCEICRKIKELDEKKATYRYVDDEIENSL